MNILITGASGLLGYHLFKFYSNLGHKVIGLDNYSNSAPKSGEAIYNVDCSDQNSLNNLIHFYKIDIIFHLACLPYEGYSNISPYAITKSVFNPTLAVASAAINNNVKRIYNFSSMARYGRGKVPFTEKSKKDPIDPYGIAKVAAEDILNNLSDLYNFEVVHLVPHNVFGTNVRWNDIRRGVINIFIMQALLSESLTIHNDGEQKRSFSFVEDALSFAEQLLYCKVKNKEVFNIGPDTPDTYMSINELAKIILEETKSKSDIQYIEKINDLKYASCSSEKIKKKFAWQSKVDVREEIIKMIHYAKSNIDLKSFSWKNFVSVEIDKKCPDYWK